MRGYYEHNGKSGTWSGRIDLPRAVDGRRKQMRVSARTKSECERKIRKLLDDADKGFPTSACARRYTVGDAIDAWLATRRGLARRTYDSYVAESNRHLRPKLGHVPVVQVTRGMVDRVVADWEVEPRADGRPGPRSATSVRYYTTLLFMVMESARRDGYRHDNPVADARRPKRIRPVKPIVDAAGAAAILDALVGTDLYVPVILQFASGSRVGELLAFQLGDVDMLQDCIHVRRAVEYRGRHLAYKGTKSETGRRTLRVARAVMQVLGDHMDAQRGRLALFGITPTSSTPLFDRGDGEIWHPDSFRRAYKRRLKSQEITPLPLRGTRHSFATMARSVRTDYGVLRLILGHSDEGITRRHYVEEEEDVQAARRASENVTEMIQRHRARA